ncbi:MAG: hypothetical protein K2X27_25820, partial [Candidatus Obscuribacterales bacterium]|nr:hypothetical protein [Candidatus Obscuribacterales bacterium]
LAAMPPAKYDTIRILNNRIALLHSLKINLEFFDSDLLALMRETGFDANWSTEKVKESSPQAVQPGLNPTAAEAASLLGVTEPVIGLFSSSQLRDEPRLRNELSLVRKTLQALIECRVTADRLEFEIVKETETRDRMVSSRDRGIAFTDNANFFQLGILGIIGSGPLGLSGQKRYQYYNHCMALISGYLVAGLTTASFLQRKGGYRPTKVMPNMLSQVLGLETDADLKFSPFIWKFLNSPNPLFDSKETRREQLIMYWKKLRVISLDPEKTSAAEKLAANGKAHHWWCESIKLINSRLNMLYAVHAAVDLLEKDLSDLLMSAE